MSNQDLKFKKLTLVPQAVKEWFGGEKIIPLIQEVRDKFHISQDDTTIPRLLLLLELRDLEPQYFSWELSSSLSLDRDKAKLISAEIEKSILEPIKDDLKTYGIEVKDLLLFETPSVIKRVGDKYTSVAHADVPEAAPKEVEQVPKPDIPRPVLMKEVPRPTVLREETSVPKPAPAPMPRPKAEIPKPEMKIPAVPKPVNPARPGVLSPFGFEKEVRPVNTPLEFKLGGIPKPNIKTVPDKTPTRAARVELGGEEIKKAVVPEFKVVGREPIHYTEPKSAFMPGGVKLTPPESSNPKPQAPQPPKPTAPVQAKKDVPLPTYPIK